MIDLTQELRQSHGHLIRAPLTEAETFRKAVGISRGPAPTVSGLVLLTHKRQVRKTLRQIISQLQGPAALTLPLGGSHNVTGYHARVGKTTWYPYGSHASDW